MNDDHPFDDEPQAPACWLGSLLLILSATMILAMLYLIVRFHA